MNPNIIFEGNTIYELDPDCVRKKEEKDKKKAEEQSRVEQIKEEKQKDKK